MSAVTVSTMPGRDASPRPIPWRRMAWVTWRQHRVALAGVGVLLGAAGAYVAITGVQMQRAYATASACHPASSDVCRQVVNDFFNKYEPTSGLAAGLLHVIPALIGAFAGAPMLAREFESGTFRYAWTQGVGRMRWTVAKLAPLAVALAIATAAFSVLFSWAYQPVIGKPGYGPSPLDPRVFDLRGFTFAAWTLAAFAIGAMAGVLIRRVIPAMFACLATSTGLILGTALYLRRHYEPALVSTNPTIAPPDWVMSQEWTRNGKPASLSMIDGALHPVGVQALSFERFQPGPGTPDNFDPVQYLAHHGFTQVTVYQPASRFWPFQWIEGGWLLALALLLTFATLWLIRRRAT